MAIISSGTTMITGGAFQGVEGTPTGAVVCFGKSSLPSGFIFCDGSAVSRTTYADLFTAIGTSFGSGDGSTTFNVPDLRGRVPAGKDNMGGTSANRLTSAVSGSTLGASGGSQVHTLSTSEMASHNHTVTISGQNQVSGGHARLGGTGSTSSKSTGSKGSNGSHNNTQPTIILNYGIKT